MESNTERTAASTQVPIKQPADSPPNVRPLSPTYHSRIVEKVELQNLNDRLACYIDRVRYLEVENTRLTVQMQTSTETINREMSNIKQTYEHELSNGRKLLNELSLEKAELEIDMTRLWEEKDDLKQKYDKKCMDSQIAQDSAHMYKSKYDDIESKYSSAVVDCKNAVEESKDLERELNKLRKRNQEYQKSLESETLVRIDLENTIQSLREELTFKHQVHTLELNETRARHRVDISNIDGLLADQYEAKLQQSLQELRDQYEVQMRSNRDEIETLFDSKIKNVQNAAQRDKQALNTALKDLRNSSSCINIINAKIGELKQTNSSLKDRIRDLQQMLDGERARNTEFESEINRLHEEMTQQLQDYQDLMDMKVSLNLEIAAYDKLLCGEEHRLNITPSNSTTDSRLSQSFSSSVSGTSSLRRSAAKRSRNIYYEQEESSYDSEVNTVMKTQKWYVGQEIKTALVDSDGKEEATAERILHQITTKSSLHLNVSGCGQIHHQSQGQCSTM